MSAGAAAQAAEPPTTPGEETMDLFPTYAALCARNPADPVRHCIRTESARVPAGVKLEFSFDVEPPNAQNSHFEWEVKLSERDILYSVEFIELGSVRRETVIHPTLVTAAEGIVTDSFPITRAGQFSITLDNSFSYFASKAVVISGYFTTTALLSSSEDDLYWRVYLHGWLYSPRVTSVRRRMILGVLRKAFGLDSTSEQSAKFNERLRLFITNNLIGHTVTVTVGSEDAFSSHAKSRLREVTLTAGGNGHFHGHCDLPFHNVSPSRKEIGLSTIRCQVEAPTVGRKEFAPVTLLLPNGLSVISDVDDTIKESQVSLGKRRVFENIFLRDAVAVEQMAEFYSSLASKGVCFHYVSNTPWQLHGTLATFITKHGFPMGTFHLKSFNLSDQTRSALLQPPEVSKRAAIFRLLRDNPERKFILIGDSGERDPELYASICTHYPNQIALVVIRYVHHALPPRSATQPSTPGATPFSTPPRSAASTPPPGSLPSTPPRSGTATPMREPSLLREVLSPLDTLKNRDDLLHSISSPTLPSAERSMVRASTDSLLLQAAESMDQLPSAAASTDSLAASSSTASLAASGETRRCSTRAEVELRVRLTFAHLRTPCVIVDDGAEAIASEELNEALRPYFEEMQS